MSEKRILLFGASTMAGFWDPRGGWFARLREEVDSYSLKNKHNQYQLYNCSISGDTSKGLRNRIKTELKARNHESKEIAALISIGGNDALFYKNKGENQTDLEEFGENLQNILEKAIQISDKTLFISGTPFKWSKTDPLPWNEDKAYRKEDIERYRRKKLISLI